MADLGAPGPIQRFAHILTRLPLSASERGSLSFPSSDENFGLDREKSRDDILDLEKSADARKEDAEPLRIPPTLPPWVQSLNDGDNNTEAREVSYFFPDIPNPAHRPHHPYVPTPKPGLEPGRGKLMDSGRNREPTIIGPPFALTASKWQYATRGAALLRCPDVQRIPPDETMAEETAAKLETPWHLDGMDDEAPKDETLWLLSNDKRAATLATLQRILMKNAFVPLIIRVTVLMFVLCALGIGVTIYRDSNSLNGDSNIRTSTNGQPGFAADFICEQQPSTYMAFIVDSVAVIYLLYITWDEYMSKPLGLRRSRDKVRLLFLDLIFIVFSSANASLAFSTLTDRQWACYNNDPRGTNLSNHAAAESTCVYDADLCARQRALCAMLIIALIAWFGTFAISVLRVVDRISR